MLHGNHISSFRPTAIIAALVVLAAASTAAAQTRSGQVERGRSDTCCLFNFRFTGACEVTLSPGQTCADVLSYLNNVNSVGRDYCGNTIIRGGWTLGECSGGSSGPFTTPGRVSAEEPSRAPAAGTMQPIQTSTRGTARGGRATFVTPVEPSRQLQVTEPGLINL